MTNPEFPGLAAPTGHATGAETDPQSHLADRQVTAIRIPKPRRNHDSAEERPRQFSKRDSHFHTMHDLPLFRGSIILKALTWKSPRSPAHAHKGWSTGLSMLLTNVTSVPQSAVSSVGFLWGSPPGRGLVGFLWGSQKALRNCAEDERRLARCPRPLVAAHAGVTERDRIPVRLKGHSGTYLSLPIPYCCEMGRNERVMARRFPSSARAVGMLWALSPFCRASQGIGSARWHPPGPPPLGRERRRCGRHPAAAR
jgi:hypothetical protein